jgi:hypothetical protein
VRGDLDRRQRDQHREAGQQHRLAGGVHRLGDRALAGGPWHGTGGPEPDDEEQRVVDAEREGEHHREVHRPDGDGEELADQDQGSRGRDQAGQGEQQREAGGHERAEGQHEDGKRNRPGQQLRLHHRAQVRLVEVSPQLGRAGGRDLDAVAGQCLQRGLQAHRRAHHVVGRGPGAAEHDGRAAVLAERRAGPRCHDRGYPVVGAEQGLRAGDHLRAAAAGHGAGVGVDHDLDGRAGLAAEVGLGELADRDRLRSVGLPPGARQRPLNPGGEDPQPEDHQQPDPNGEARMPGHGQAEPA